MVKQTAGQDALGTFAPKFAELNDDVLFGEVWSREKQLSCFLTPFLIIATSTGHQKNLSTTLIGMMNMPIIAAARLKGYIANQH